MNNIEIERLNDFKKVLTYHLVKKIKYHFKSNYNIYYKSPDIWINWSKKRNIKYSNEIYSLIIKFNDTGLSTNQVKHIFGKDSNGKYLKYSILLNNDNDIKIFKKGTIVTKNRRFQIKNRYQLPYEYIKSIFDNKELLEKVCDAGSDFYSDRQRRLIFTQINKQQTYHYKTKKELTEEQEIEKVISELF